MRGPTVVPIGCFEMPKYTHQPICGRLIDLRAFGRFWRYNKYISCQNRLVADMMAQGQRVAVSVDKTGNQVSVVSQSLWQIDIVLHENVCSPLLKFMI